MKARTERSYSTAALSIVAGLVLLAPSARAQADFNWNGPVAAGATMRVYTNAGTVTVRQSSGGEARIRGTTSNASAGNIRFVNLSEGGDVIVCALREGAECTPNGIRHERDSDDRRRDYDRRDRAEANFVVEVPRGVNVRLASGSGEVNVAGVTADVHAASGSGSIQVAAGARDVRASSGSGTVAVDGALGTVQASTGSGTVRITTSRGPVNASTGSGDIDVAIATLQGSEDMSFSTGSGTITLRLPADFSANINSSTGSGEFETDFQMVLEGRMSRHNVRGRIGNGGRTVRLSTGSGDIRILRRQ